MDRREAELLYDLGKEAIVEVLLAMSARIHDLEERIRFLEKQISSLTTNSTNSSKPPSSDDPKVTRPKKKKSSRSPGAQKGHSGTSRALLPVEAMDHVWADENLGGLLGSSSAGFVPPFVLRVLTQSRWTGKKVARWNKNQQNLVLSIGYKKPTFSSAQGNSQPIPYQKDRKDSLCGSGFQPR